MDIKKHDKYRRKLTQIINLIQSITVTVDTETYHKKAELLYYDHELSELVEKAKIILAKNGINEPKGFSYFG